MAELSFFTVDGDALVPTAMSRSLWGENQMHGVATSGALARQLERTLGELDRADLVAARYTVDLFRPATLDPVRTSATVVREGRRLALLDVVLTQGGEPVARASCLFLKPTAAPEGQVWQPSERPGPPPLDVAPVSDVPHIPYFGNQETGWSQDFRQHQNAARKSTWQTAVPVVAGERATPFQAVASIADATSMVTNWGSNGVEYINSDITLTLARPPAGMEIGLTAVDWVGYDGVAVGTAAVYDREGPLGTSVVTALGNAKRTVNFAENDFAGAGA